MHSHRNPVRSTPRCICAIACACVRSQARRFDNRLKGDDNFAAEEQRRAQSRGGMDGEGLQPTYCNSRYYKILAGGNAQGGVGCGGSY